MANMNKKICIMLLVLLEISFLNRLMAQDGQAGTESLFKLGFGARAIGMGQAYTALADDPTAVFWNPAGLEYVNRQNLTLFHTNLIEGALYDFIGYAAPTLNMGSFGFALGRIGVGDIKQIDHLNTEFGSSFSREIYIAYASYAKKILWDITAGVSAHFRRRAWSGLQGEGELADNGFGLDIGLMYRPTHFSSTLLQNWSVGLNLKNILKPKINEGIASDELPLTVRLGLMRRLTFGDRTNIVNLLLDADYSERRDLLLHLGAEYEYKELGMLRIGYNGDRFNFGAGVQYQFVQLDYAFGSSPNTDYFDSFHRISLTFHFGLTRSELFEIAEEKRIANEQKLITEMRETDRQNMVAAHMDSADQYFTDGQYFNAVVEYQLVIAQDPFNQRANLMIDSSNALLQKRFKEDQALAVQNALDKDRAENDLAFINLHFNKARTLLDQKKYTEALIEFNLALEKDPQNETIAQGMETTKRRLAEETQALIRQGRTEFNNGNYAEALRLLAEAGMIGGDDAAIQAEIEPLIARVRLQQNIQNALGLFEIGEYDQALKILEEAKRFFPENKLVNQYIEKTKIETVGKTVTMSPKMERKYLQGIDYFVKGNYIEAIKLWEEALQEYPYNKKVLKALEGAKERLKKTTM
jgi:tetratricopeptide (TPR) repeat protein